MSDPLIYFENDAKHVFYPDGDPDIAEWLRQEKEREADDESEQ